MSPKDVARTGARLRANLEKNLKDDGAPHETLDSALLALDLAIGAAYNLAKLAAGRR